MATSQVTTQNFVLYFVSFFFCFCLFFSLPKKNEFFARKIGWIGVCNMKMKWRKSLDKNDQALCKCALKYAKNCGEKGWE